MDIAEIRKKAKAQVKSDTARPEAAPEREHGARA